jgi:predicted AAA+ superfamily ATPase
MIDRPRYLTDVERALEQNPVVALLGPRQCGKTTLARVVAEARHAHYFDLENPVHANRLSQPLTALESMEDLVIIDEVQRKPELFEILRVLADRPGRTTRFLVLGSASPRLVKGASESLAGRVSFVDLSGFDLWEVGVARSRALWFRGGFPRSYLAEGDETSYRWRDDFVRTFLERDIPQLGITLPAETLRRFWTMVAHYHGQVWNAAEFARSLGSAESTARNYLDLLSGAYLVRQLQPWFENLKKRQVKSPKVYVRDSGILHALLGLRTPDAVLDHPKLGASWEGFAIEQVVIAAGTRDVYFWATQSGAELDLLIFKNGKRFGFEMKYADAPGMSKSMRSALSDLALDHLYLVTPGGESYPLDDRVSVLSISDIRSAFANR